LVFYYRIHRPVVLIEFDHQCGIVFDNDMPSRIHIHTVVRTLNANGYGKDLQRRTTRARTRAGSKSIVTVGPRKGVVEVHTVLRRYDGSFAAHEDDMLWLRSTASIAKYS
jgi:hypothetical protein